MEGYRRAACLFLAVQARQPHRRHTCLPRLRSRSESKESRTCHYTCVSWQDHPAAADLKKRAVDTVENNRTRDDRSSFAKKRLPRDIPDAVLQPHPAEFRAARSSAQRPRMQTAPHQDAMEADDVARSSRLRQHLARPREHADGKAVRPLPGLVEARIRDDHRHLYICARSRASRTLLGDGTCLAAALLCERGCRRKGGRKGGGVSQPEPLVGCGCVHSVTIAQQLHLVSPFAGMLFTTSSRAW